MCTLTYIPDPKEGFLLVSNRDESVARKPALDPGTYLHNGVNVNYPKDTQGGGTWVAMGANGFTLCLLNGAFEKHIPHPPYRKSRGLVVTDFFDFNDVERFVKEYDFNGIEPFTLIIIDQSAKQIALHEIRWNEQFVYHQPVDALSPQIWSSATLYDQEVIAERERWFHQFLQQTPMPELNDMLRFHHFGGNGDQRNDLLMNRNNILKTISITGIKNSGTIAFMHYENLLTQTLSIKEIALIKL